MAVVKEIQKTFTNECLGAGISFESRHREPGISALANRLLPRFDGVTIHTGISMSLLFAFSRFINHSTVKEHSPIFRRIAGLVHLCDAA
jgi:hypothetical protein